MKHTHIKVSKIVLDIAFPLLASALFFLNAKWHGYGLSTTLKLSVVAYALVFPFIMLYADRWQSVLKKGERITAVTLAFLFSQFLTIGASLDSTNNFALCFGNWWSVGVWLVQTIIYGYIVYKILTVIIHWFQNYDITQQEEMGINLKKWFFVILAFKVLCIVFLYPCIFDFDGGLGLRTYLDPAEVKSNHHPYFVQMIHGLFFNIGKSLGNPSIGFAILTFLFDVISTIVLVYGLSLLSRMDIKDKWLKGIAILITLSPFYLFLSHDPTKDGFFTCAFLAYCLTLFEVYASGKTCFKSWKFLFSHSLSALLLCLTRNQGIYIVAVSSLFLMLYYRRYILNLLAAIVPAIVLALLFSHVYLPRHDVQPGSKAEMFGTLFQQTAYTLKCYPDDITPEEEAAISAIMSIDKIKEVYAPQITDPVKGQYGQRTSLSSKTDTLLHFSKERITDEGAKLKAYFKAWGSMLVRHPVCYTEAAAAVCYGFFYNKGQMLCILCTDWPESKATTAEYSFRQNVRAMVFVNDLFGFAPHIPIFNWLGSVPYYIWLFILLMALLLLRRDWQGIILTIPLLLSLAILLVCPTVDARYMYPILAVLPFLFVYVLKTNNNANRNEKSSSADSVLQ